MLTNSGLDIMSAFSHATADPEIRQTQFTSSVGVAINTSECRALSAPGLREAYALPAPRGGGDKGNKSSSALALPDPPSSTLSRSQAQKVKKKAKKARLRAHRVQADNAAKKANGNGRAPKALQNGGVGDGAGGKGGGKGSGKGKRKNKTADGREICFSYSNGNCQKAECARTHVCQICEGQHPATECPNK